MSPWIVATKSLYEVSAKISTRIQNVFVPQEMMYMISNFHCFVQMLQTFCQPLPKTFVWQAYVYVEEQTLWNKADPFRILWSWNVLE